MKITDNEFYKENQRAYEVITDYIRENHQEVNVIGVEPVMPITVELDDCIIDEQGDLYVPTFYTWTYKGSNETDDRDEYNPVYNPSSPTLTKLQITNLIALADEPEINDKARNI